MAAVFIWKCQCDCRLKVIHESDGMSYVRCPRPTCPVIHIVDGKVASLWMQFDDAEPWLQLSVESYLRGNQPEHVDEKRMCALAELKMIFEEPEWKHMKNCEDCLSAFAEKVAEKYGKKAQRTH